MTRQIDQRADVRIYGFRHWPTDMRAMGECMALANYLGSEAEFHALNLSVTGTCTDSDADLVIFGPHADPRDYWMIRRLANRGSMVLLLGEEPNRAYDEEMVRSELAEVFAQEGICGPSLESVGFCLQIPDYQLPDAPVYYVGEGSRRTLIYSGQVNRDLMDLLVDGRFLDALVQRDEMAIRESVTRINEQQTSGRIIISGCLSDVLDQR